MQINETTYNAMPAHLRALFVKLPNPGRDEVVALFPFTKSGKDATDTPTASSSGFTGHGTRGAHCNHGDSGSAARFFYCAKASRADRNEGLPTGDAPAVATGATMREREDADWPARNGNHHPTVKPTDLMAYLCRLVTPAGGIVLDPFMGSGSTGRAAGIEQFKFIGIEVNPEYFEIACLRIDSATAQQGLEFA